MNAFVDFDEAGFLELQPAAKGQRRVDLRLAFSRMRSAERLLLIFRNEILDEIGGPRYDVAWNAAKRMLLVKSGPQARFEAHAYPKGGASRITVPVPAGLVFSDDRIEPEFYVDAIGKRLLVEVPVEFGRRLALPAPSAPKAPDVAPVREVIPAGEIEAGNRQILQALGVTNRFPREFGSVRFAPAEAAILEALFRGKDMSREALLAATHDPAGGDDDRDAKVVDVWLSKMRPRLAELDISIKTLGRGFYGMDATSKGILREMLRQAGFRA